MKKILRVIVLLLLIAGIAAVIVYRDQIDPSALENWVKDAGSAGPVVFMLFYIIGTVFFFPGAALTLAGGGFIWSCIWNIL